MNKSILHPDYHDLFHAIQMQVVFPDSKTCCDLIPNRSLDAVYLDFTVSKDQADFSLAEFISLNFDQTKIEFVDIPKFNKAGEHVAHLWSKLEREDQNLVEDSTKIGLPFPYIVPGGRFQEMYYWDTYFTIQGLNAEQIDICENLIKNFTHYINTFGFIPNGNREYFLTRSQPPFYALMLDYVWTLANREPTKDELLALKAEYSYWHLTDEDAAPASRHAVKIDDVILHRYFDTDATARPEAYREDLELTDGMSADDKKRCFTHLRAACESGWDFSARWFAHGANLASTICADILPVDLNSLLIYYAQLLNQFEDGGRNKIDWEAKWNMVEKCCWNSELGIFCDYNFVSQKNMGKPTAACLYPLFLSLCTSDQAERTANFIEKNLIKPGGIVSSLEDSGQQWDWPNGWAPLQFVAYKGLKNYGFDTLANEIATRFCTIIEKTYAETGKMMEKYNVVDLNISAGGGEYPNQDGFGWTNGVYAFFKRQLT